MSTPPVIDYHPAPGSGPRVALPPAVVGVLGLGVTLAGLYLAGGWGLPTVLFVVGGPAVVLLVDQSLGRVRRLAGWEMQVLLLVVAGLLVALAGWASVRISPDGASRAAFGQPVPAGVTVTQTSRQYSDGTIILVRFNAAEAALNQLRAARPFQEDAERMAWVRSGTLTWAALWSSEVSFAARRNRSWATPPPMAQPRLLTWRSPGDELGGGEHTTILWDAASGQGYAIYVEH